AAVRSTTGATATSMRSLGRLRLLCASALSTAFLPQAAKSNVEASVSAMSVFLKLAGFMIKITLSKRSPPGWARRSAGLWLAYAAEKDFHEAVGALLIRQLEVV